MTTIEYFKLQAKNLHKDFKTQKPYFDSSLGSNFFQYESKFFDVDALITDFDIDESHFTLMNAQHIIAKLAGFEQWTEMLTVSPDGLELGKLLFDNMHKINIEEWQDYILDIERANDVAFDDEDKLDIFKKIFADKEGHRTYGYDYRLDRSVQPSLEPQEIKPKEKKSRIKITTLPLVGKDRQEFIESANEKFEDIIRRIEPGHPASVRKMWNAGQYIDEGLQPSMLPIDRDEALSMMRASLIQHVIYLAVEADRQG